MNVPYLLKILGTKKISELVENIDLPPLDINLLLDDAVAEGQIEVNREKDKIKALKDPEISFDADLANKLLRTMQNYEKQEKNITRGKLNSLVKDPATGVGYGWHDYLTSLQYLIDSGQVEEVVVGVPAVGDRPYHKFVFLCFPDNPNEDWNRAVVNKWVDSFAKKK